MSEILIGEWMSTFQLLLGENRLSKSLQQNTIAIQCNEDLFVCLI